MRAVRRPLGREDYDARVLDATFLPINECVVTIDSLKPSVHPYVILPCTYGRDKAGAFSLEVTSNVEFFLVEGVSQFALRPQP